MKYMDSQAGGTLLGSAIGTNLSDQKHVVGVLALKLAWVSIFSYPLHAAFRLTIMTGMFSCMSIRCKGLWFALVYSST